MYFLSQVVSELFFIFLYKLSRMYQTYLLSMKFVTIHYIKFIMYLFSLVVYFLGHDVCEHHIYQFYCITMIPQMPNISQMLKNLNILQTLVTFEFLLSNLGYNPIRQKDNCQRLCGNISVPFPFGLEEGCFARKLFQLNFR